jgi:hypothetical protein
MMNAAKISLLEVIAGIWLIAAVVILAGVFFVPNPLAYVLGEIVGSAVSSLLMLHLYRSIDVELDLTAKKRAIWHARLTSIVRSLLEIAVLTASCFLSEWVLPYTVLAGFLARKFAVMLVPAMEHIRQRKNHDNQTDFSVNRIPSEE